MCSLPRRLSLQDGAARPLQHLSSATVLNASSRSHKHVHHVSQESSKRKHYKKVLQRVGVVVHGIHVLQTLSPGGGVGKEVQLSPDPPVPKVDQRIAVFWPIECQWFHGRVNAFSESDKPAYQVIYDDGDTAWHPVLGPRALDWRQDGCKEEGAEEVEEEERFEQLSLE